MLVYPNNRATVIQHVKHPPSPYVVGGTPVVSDQFTSNFVRNLIPDLYKEMHTNTALGPIFDAYVPNGIDTSKFGRIVTVNT